MKTFTTPANTTPATQHFTFFDLETHWDEVLHNNYCFIEQTQSWPPRIGTRRIRAAAAFDLALAEDGAITCERIGVSVMVVLLVCGGVAGAKVINPRLDIIDIANAPCLFDAQPGEAVAASRLRLGHRRFCGVGHTDAGGVGMRSSAI